MRLFLFPCTLLTSVFSEIEATLLLLNLCENVICTDAGSNGEGPLAYVNSPITFDLPVCI